MIQEEFHKPVEWNNRNNVTFNSTKCKITYLGTNTKNFCCD